MTAGLNECSTLRRRSSLFHERHCLWEGINYITLHYITLHYITLHYITLHYIALRYIALHYITLHCITLHCIALHCITLHYITLHYVTLHDLSITSRRGPACSKWNTIALPLDHYVQYNIVRLPVSARIMYSITLYGFQSQLASTSKSPSLLLNHSTP